MPVTTDATDANVTNSSRSGNVNRLYHTPPDPCHAGSIQQSRDTSPNTAHQFVGHSTLSAATFLTLAVLIASLEWRRGAKRMVFGLAGLLVLSIGVSRVYLGVHWPTDVIAGLLLGWGWALLVFHWARPKLAG